MAVYLGYFLFELSLLLAPVCGITFVVIAPLLLWCCFSISTIHYMARKMVPFLKAGEGDTENKPVTVLRGQPLADIHVMWLLGCSLYMIGFFLLKFARHYIFYKVYSCNSEDGFNCFDANSLDLYEQHLNCENTTELELKNITFIVCYRFSFDVAYAASQVVSMLTVVVGFISFLSWILIEVVNFKCMAHSSKKRRYSVVILLQIFIVLVAYAMLMLRIMISTTMGLADYAEFFIYLFIIGMPSGLIPWWIFDNISRSISVEQIPDDVNVAHDLERQEREETNTEDTPLIINCKSYRKLTYNK